MNEGVGFQQEHVDLLENGYEIGKKIRIIFTNATQEDGFQGFSVSYYSEN